MLAGPTDERPVPVQVVRVFGRDGVGLVPLLLHLLERLQLRQCGRMQPQVRVSHTVGVLLHSLQQLPKCLGSRVGHTHEKVRDSGRAFIGGSYTLPKKDQGAAEQNRPHWAPLYPQATPLHLKRALRPASRRRRCRISWGSSSTSTRLAFLRAYSPPCAAVAFSWA